MMDRGGRVGGDGMREGRYNYNPDLSALICSCVSVSGNSTLNFILREPVSPFFSKPKPGIVFTLPGLMMLPGLFASLNTRPLIWLISKSNPQSADFNGIVFSTSKSRCSTLKTGC